jgi:hypothetical protein
MMDKDLSVSKAARLAQYLNAFVALHSTAVSDVEKCGAVLRFGEMPQETESGSLAWNDELAPGTARLRVSKQLAEQMSTPRPVIACAKWVNR